MQISKSRLGSSKAFTLWGGNMDDIRPELAIGPLSPVASPNKRSQHFCPPRIASRRARLRIRPYKKVLIGRSIHGATDAQAGVPSAKRPQAQLAFKNSMVHGILQFTPRIAFRYVLHRCENRDIRCRESFDVTNVKVMDAWNMHNPNTSLIKCTLAPITRRCLAKRPSPT